MAIKIACLLAEDFEDSEFRIPFERFKARGYQVEVIGAKAGETLEGKKGKETARVDRSIADADVREYDALFIPGGGSPDHLRADGRFVQFVKDFDATKRPLAAVCHGPQLLLSAGLVKGRTLTAWKTVQKDLELAGAGHERRTTFHALHPNEKDIEREAAGENLSPGEGPIGAQPEDAP